MRQGVLWTPNEISILRAIYPNNDAEECAKYIDRSVNAIKVMAFKLCIRKSDEYNKRVMAKRIAEWKKNFHKNHSIKPEYESKPHSRYDAMGIECSGGRKAWYWLKYKDIKTNDIRSSIGNLAVVSINGIPIYYLNSLSVQQ